MFLHIIEVGHLEVLMRPQERDLSGLVHEWHRFVHEQEVRRRAAKIQVALESSYRPGQWPAKFPDTLRQEDPWSGLPLKYARDEKGYRIYSVGENGIDDGGQPGGLDIVISRLD